MNFFLSHFLLQFTHTFFYSFTCFLILLLLLMLFFEVGTQQVLLGFYKMSTNMKLGRLKKMTHYSGLLFISSSFLSFHPSDQTVYQSSFYVPNLESHWSHFSFIASWLSSLLFTCHFAATKSLKHNSSASTFNDPPPTPSVPHLVLSTQEKCLCGFKKWTLKNIDTREIQLSPYLWLESKKI